MQTDSIDILRDVLSNLNWHDIPTDLSEIDANWCYNRLYEYCAGEVREHLHVTTYEDMNAMAGAFKDLWSEAIADDTYYLQGRW
jgi:hypothetical protein